MSEETQIETIQPPEVFLSIGDNQTVEVRFADGVYGIPPHIVGYFKKEEFEALLPDLIHITYNTFLAGFTRKVQIDNLNKFQHNFVSNHFRRMF